MISGSEQDSLSAALTAASGNHAQYVHASSFTIVTKDHDLI